MRAKLRFLAVLILLVETYTASFGQDNLNDKGRKILKAIQSNHYRQLKIDDKASQHALRAYLDFLDPQRLYFTQEDVSEFKTDFGRNLLQLVAENRGMEPALKIYRRYAQRVREHEKFAQSVLTTQRFDFQSQKSILRNRQLEDWPKNKKHVEDIWLGHLESNLLSETLKSVRERKNASQAGAKSPDLVSYADAARRVERSSRHVTDKDDAEIADYFFNSLASVWDPHTTFLSKRKFENFNIGFENRLVGIGALIEANDGRFIIKGIIKGGPADRQGSLRINDEIIAIGEGPASGLIDVTNMRLTRVVSMIRGNKDSTVRLKIQRGGGVLGVELITIRRGEIQLKDSLATAKLLKLKSREGLRRFGWLSIPSFYIHHDQRDSGMASDVTRMLSRLNRESIDGLILDLRDNGGGSLQEAQRLVGLFVGSAPVLQVRKRSVTNSLDSGIGKALYSGPLVVLTNSASASASEIVAAALQDYNRAVIVGESSTFGKGTVQRLLPIERRTAGKEAIKVTIAKYYRVTGSSTQRMGVVPDIILPSISDPSKTGERLLKHALSHDQIKKSSGFRPMVRSRLEIPSLRRRSQDRVAASKDFRYILEDAARLRESRKENRISLNRATTESLFAEHETRRKVRNAERRMRFETIEKEDAKRLRILQVSLDDSEHGELVALSNMNAQVRHMKLAPAKPSTLDQTPSWPSGLDPVSREGLAVLSDLVTRLSPKKADDSRQKLGSISR